MTITDLDLDIGATAPSDDALTTVASLAQRQVDLEDAIAARKEELKTLNEALRVVREVELPAAMASAGPSGIAKFSLGNGFEVKDELRYRCPQLDDAADQRQSEGQEAARRPLAERLAAFAWLDSNGHGDLAKHVITIALGRGDEALVDEILAWLRAASFANRLAVDRRRVVAWNTLAAFAKDMDHDYPGPPLELLGVTKGHVTKIVRPKRDTDNGFD
jgi:hypothetical protein